MQFSEFSGKLSSVSERKNNMKNEKKKFLNVTFKVERHPNYTGNHDLARVNNVMGNTFSIGTTEADMIKEFHAETVGTDINGKTWTTGEIVQVVSIEKCFEDSCD